MKRIPIAAAERLSKADDLPMVIIFAIGGDGQFCVTTYGKTKALCRCAAAYGEQIAEAVMKGIVEPPAHEPLHLPGVPAQTGYRMRRGPEP